MLILEIAAGVALAPVLLALIALAGIGLTAAADAIRSLFDGPVGAAVAGSAFLAVCIAVATQ